MIGRGTRVLDDDASEEALVQGEGGVLIIDCWDNFEYFGENPTASTDSNSMPMPIRLFKARLTGSGPPSKTPTRGPPWP